MVEVMMFNATFNNISVAVKSKNVKSDSDAIMNKCNNNIIELRTILQRESQNS
jgi:hypothetical protein